ncbi:hypothetical protein EZV62_023447 [Acer yangbiense]|uniref:Purple acid phosphatase n=1 Tax=Acer yangbiense TaxID=1000413 RepID=A0A5C7H1T3_9ROSI|nr:hypothetical protein EZV62_023447 [Acer yangbiense]
MAQSLWFLFIITNLVFSAYADQLQRFEHPTKTHESLSFLVLGDWGRRGDFNQSQVALQMGRIGEKLDIDFLVSTGDNFYEDGLTGENDILGNHDYRGDVLAQLSPFLRKIDSRWLCLRSFIVDTGEQKLTEIFFVDTTPFVNMYFTNEAGHKYDWRGINSRKAYISNLLKDLDLALKESTAKWKIVIGHHAIRSIGHHGDTQELIKHILPLLKNLESALKSSVATWKIVIGHHAIRSVGHHGDTKELIHQILPILEANNVDFYVNGHDHCLQHISSSTSPIQFLTSGGGSKAWRGVIDYDQLTKNETQFYYDGQGFMSVELNQAQAHIKFYNVFGQVLHTLNLSNHLRAAADDSLAIATY